MGAAIRPRPVFVKVPQVIPGWSQRVGALRRPMTGSGPDPESRDSPMCNCTSEVRVCGAPRNDTFVSDRRIPRCGNDPVTVAVLFDIAEPGERIVEALHLQLLCNHHVVDPAAGLLGHISVL